MRDFWADLSDKEVVAKHLALSTPPTLQRMARTVAVNTGAPKSRVIAKKPRKQAARNNVIVLQKSKVVPMAGK